jgi:hypothetical protein
MDAPLTENAHSSVSVSKFSHTIDGGLEKSSIAGFKVVSGRSPSKSGYSRERGETFASFFFGTKMQVVAFLLEIRFTILDLYLNRSLATFLRRM